MKKKLWIKEQYILVVIIIGLLTLGLYSTYAMFTYSDETGNVISMTANDFSINLDLMEYETIELSENSYKTINVSVKNSTSSTMYYGVWYQMVSPSSITSDITVAKLDGTTVDTTGSVSASATKNVTLIVINNSSLPIKLNIGAIGNTSSSLGLASDKSVITGSAGIPSYPNEPRIVDGLVPVVYQETCSDSSKTYTEGGCWVVADSTNANNSWYDYDNQKWANAVLVSSTNRSTYKAANAKGTVITQSDILAYYVWIPRFKYKVWNITKTAAETSHQYPDGTSARDNGIDIKWESGTGTTGTVTCNYDFTKEATDTVRVEECTGNNGDYYTHPAFFVDTNQNSIHDTGEQELTGFWMGKYELGSEVGTASTSDSTYGGGENATYTPRVLPNISSWRYNYIPNWDTVVKNMTVSSNIYGLSSSQINSHLITNQEWGAVSYLANSKYGRCASGTCEKVQRNSFGETSKYTTRTGCGPTADGNTSTYNTTCNQYTSTLGNKSSTTGNVYGVYDLNGGAYEYVMGNMSSSSNPTTFVLNLKSFYGTFSATPTYINGYDYGTDYQGQIAVNRAHLGDATGEVMIGTGSTSAWNSANSDFVDSSYPWFVRGGNFNNSNSGLWYYGRNKGLFSSAGSSRPSLS